MKRFAVLGAVVAVAAAALYYGEHSKADAPVTPAPLMHVIGDAEREATRVPMQMTRLSDDQEIEAGNHIADAYLASLPQASTDEDAAMQAYVERLGRSLAANAHRRLSYRFPFVPDMGFSILLPCLAAMYLSAKG